MYVWSQLLQFSVNEYSNLVSSELFGEITWPVNEKAITVPFSEVEIKKS